MGWNLLLLTLLSVFLYAVYVKVFKRARQYEREDGLASHQQKNGTITMGGIIFVVLPLFFIQYDAKTISIAITMFLYGLLGFIDDLLITIKHNNKGIPPTLKLILQILIAGITFIIYLQSGCSTILDLKIIKIDIRWVFGLVILGLLASATNAFNLTDGVDGLCAGLSLLVSLAFIYIAILKKEETIAYMILCVSLPLFVFWCFNLPKAFLFMGDTGSLCLGAFYAMIAIYLQSLVAYIILVSLFIFETISVILQVFYYKKTGGKRIFKMAPFHHHLEACGWKEITIDLLFYLIQIVLIIMVMTCHLY